MMIPRSDRRRPRLLSCLTAGLLSLLLAAPAALAGTYVVTSGAASGGTGATDRPWPSVAAALSSGRLQGGDTLLLTAGNHGPLDLAGVSFDPPLKLVADTGAPVHLDRIRIAKSSGLALSGFEVGPRQDPQKIETAVVLIETSAKDITLARLDIRGWSDADSYYSWTAADWLSRRNKGVQIDGRNVTLQDSRLTGVTTGVGIGGTGARVIGNEIRGFSKDGMRVVNSHALIQGNTIRDCIKVDKNHDDGIQSWAKRGGAPDLIEDVVIDGNRILEWTGPRDHPLRGGLQGIGLFNGPYANWVIQNNLVMSRVRHGIALYGIRDSRIVNNTVIHIDGSPGKQPWIHLSPARVADGNVVANNIAQGLHLGKERWPWPNALVQNPLRELRDMAGGDFRLPPGSNRPDPDAAPPLDIDGSRRSRSSGDGFGAFATQ